MSSFDKLTIETPEQTSLDFPLAGLGSRFLALLADRLLQFFAALVLVAIAAVAVPASRWRALAGALGSHGPQWVIAIFVLVAFFIESSYFALFEAIWNGQTPGKRLAKIRVIKDDGRAITPYDAIARNLLRTVDDLPGFYGVGVLSILFSKENKRLGDFVAGTVVVHEKMLEAARPFMGASPAAAAAPATAYDVSRITLDELHLMESFFQRRDSFDPALRTSMAAQIASRIGEKLDVRVVGWPATENFLESVYSQFRSTNRLQST